MKNRLKRTISAVLTLSLLMSICALPSLAAGGEGADSAQGTFELLKNIAVTDSPYTPEGDYSFYLYSPSDPHDFDLMSGQLNAVIFVYPDQPFASQEEAYARLEELGLIDIAESAPAYIICPNPLNGESYTQDDLNVYYESQIYLAGGKIISFTPPAGEYERRTYNNLQYIVAEGSGATFVHNVLSQNASRIASILTFGGEMDEGLDQGLALPAYLVSPSQTAVDYYKAVNGTDSEPEAGRFVNSSYTEKQVIVKDGSSRFDAATIAKAWGTLLSRITRAPMQSDVVANTFDMSEWVLMSWPNYSELGLTLKEHTYPYDGKDYVVYDYIPDSYTGDEAVPLVVLLHGFSEDPLCPAATCGWADVAAEEGFILVAPDYLNDIESKGIAVDCVMQIVKETLETYNIDRSRVYLTGFSMGGMNTFFTSYLNTETFAAIAPMAGFPAIAETIDTGAEEYDLPTFFLTGLADDKNVSFYEDGTIGVNAMGGNTAAAALRFNGIEVGEPDYSLNPWGYQADDSDSFIRQGIRYDVSDFYANGYTNPMVRLVGVENVAHACSNVYASLAWDYISRFARGEDGSVVELVSGSGNPAPDTPSDPEPTSTYVVQKGDSLWKIAKELLGSGSRWNELYEANRDVIRNPNKIYVGLELAIPG